MHWVGFLLSPEFGSRQRAEGTRFPWPDDSGPDGLGLAHGKGKVTAFPPQEPTLEKQIQRSVSMAALATVCEATDQKPDLQLGFLDAGPMERFLASLQLNQTLQKPHPEEQSRCVHPLECSVALKGSRLLLMENLFVSVIEVVTAQHCRQGFGNLEMRPRSG